AHAAVERAPPGNDEGHAGGPMEALVGGGGAGEQIPLGEGHLLCSKAAHRVEQERSAEARAQGSEASDVVQASTGGLVVDGDHVGEGASRKAKLRTVQAPGTRPPALQHLEVLSLGAED